MTTRKTVSLTLRTFVGKVMCLLFNMLSRFFIAISVLHFLHPHLSRQRKKAGVAMELPKFSYIVSRNAN